MVVLEHLNLKGNCNMATVEQIQKEIEAKKVELQAAIELEKKAVAEKIRKWVEEYSLTPAMCGFRKKKGEGSTDGKPKSEPKYQFKNSKGEMVGWAGVGRIPKDLDELLKKSGQTLEKFKDDPKNAYVKPQA